MSENDMLLSHSALPYSLSGRPRIAASFVRQRDKVWIQLPPVVLFSSAALAAQHSIDNLPSKTKDIHVIFSKWEKMK